MLPATTSKRSSTPSSRKSIQGTPADNGWRSYDAGKPTGPSFFVEPEPAKELARAILGEDPERGVRVVRWYRLVTTERI